MTNKAMIDLVKEHLKIADDKRDLDISDLIADALSYCNLKELPEALEPYIRKKVQSIIAYEAENGTGSVFDVSSIKEGDTSINYNINQVNRNTIYGLSDADKAVLRRYRRLRTP